MTTPITPARSRALLVVVVAIVVTLLATAVSSVAVTLLVLLTVVPILAAIRLGLTVLDGGAENDARRLAPILALVIVGISLLAAGISSVVTLWVSSFARFMYLENLGLQGTTGAAITRVTPVDRGLLVFGGILALVGATLLVAAAVLARRLRPLAS